MDTRETEDGRQVFVARDEGESGSDGRFLRVYRTEDRSEAHGYLCENCESLDTAMDTMGRIVCNDCGNTHKPDEWDAVTGD